MSKKLNLKTVSKKTVTSPRTVSRNETMEVLRYRVSFEKLIMDISTRFINLPSDNINDGINQALKLIGEFTGVDRSYVFLISDHGETMTNTHEWCSHGIIPQIQRLKNIRMDDEFPWVSKIIKKREILHIPRVADLPEEARKEKKEFQLEGIQSLICVPMVSESSLIGFLGFDSVRNEKSWTEDTISLLKIVGEIIVNSLRRKSNQDEIRESEDRYRGILENIEDGYYEVDIAGNFTFFNDSLCRILGYSRDELSGMNNRQYTNQEDAKKLYQAFNKVYKTGKPEKAFSWKIIRKDGTNRFAEASISLIQNQRGESVGFRGMVHDITERKKAEENLKESEEKYRILVDKSLQGILIAQGIPPRFLFANPALLNMLGYTFEEIISFTAEEIEQLVHPEDRVTFFKDYKNLLMEGPVPSHYEVRGVRKDGKIVWFELAAALVEYKGQPAVQATFIDITERKQTEEALRKSDGETKHLAQENAVMAEIGRIIGSTLNLEEVYERLAEEVKKIIPFDRISISTIDLDHSTTTIAYTAGVEIIERYQGMVIPLAGTVTEEVLRTRSNLIIDMEDKDDIAARFPGLIPTLTSRLRSLMLIPLISKDQMIGVLHLRATKPKAYSEKDLMLAEKVGNQIAGAIANAQLFANHKQAEKALRRSEEEAKRFAQENEIVAEIGRIISSSLDIDEVYERFSEEVRRLIPFDLIVINQINSEGYTTTIAYTTGLNVPKRRAGDIIPLKGTLAEEIYRTRSSLILQMNSLEELKKRFPGIIPTFQVGIRSIISAPLISKDQVIATLSLRSKDVNAYSGQDLKLIERVGDQIAGTIANAQLFIEHKRAEEALKESRETLATVLDSVDADIYIGDITTYEILFMNKHMKESFGKNLVGKICWKVFRNESSPCPQCTNDKLLGPDGHPSGSVIWESQNPITGRWYINSDRAIPWVDGRFVRLQVATDTTELKRAEQEKYSLEEQLRQSQKMEAIGRLAGGIAHDFNNLLTIIKGYSQLSLLDLKEGDPLRENIDEIQKASQRAADLTRQLLAFSRRQMMEMKVLNLNTLLKDLDKMLRRVIGEDIDLVTVLAPDLGSAKVDSGQIEQLIMNLAVNARDAMANGGKLTVQTYNLELNEGHTQTHVAVTPGHYVMLSVSDTGVGMDPGIKDRIFEPFFTTKEKGKGTGLGLSTVYGIVKQSGGEIEVLSEPGRGTTFKIYLPRINEPVGEPREDLAGELLPRGEETILVVEDEEEVRKLAVRILKGQGYNVLEASNGKEALGVYHQQKKPIQLILTDVVMPEMGGKELADRVNLLWPGTKVLFTSGYTDDAIVHHGVLEPGIAFQKKPYSPSVLIRKVREVLDS